MRQPSSQTYLVIGSAIAVALIGSDLARLAATRHLPAGELRQAAFAAAVLFGAVGLSSRHTHKTLDLARRIERARSAELLEARVVSFPTPIKPG